jgi:hypothetical protein
MNDMTLGHPEGSIVIFFFFLLSQGGYCMRFDLIFIVLRLKSKVVRSQSWPITETLTRLM